MFRRVAAGAVLAVLLGMSAASAQFSTSYYGGGDYRTLYSYYPDRPFQWPGAPDFYGRPLVRETIIYYPMSSAVSLPPPMAPVTINVIVPAAAELWIEGKKMGQTGSERKFISPPLEGGQRFFYDFRIRFKDDGRDQTKTRSLAVFAGRHYIVDFVNPPKMPGRIEEFPPTKKEKILEE
jgi:uncharacterized protein (TIGR03000 family)